MPFTKLHLTIIYSQTVYTADLQNENAKTEHQFNFIEEQQAVIKSTLFMNKKRNNFDS